MTKDEILVEIRRTASENGGRPLGRGRFAQVTGIKDDDWGRYWARFGDAQREAGFEPNKLTVALHHDFLMEKLMGLIRELQKIPTDGEMRLQRHRDPEFPSHGVFDRYGRKRELVRAVLVYSRGKPGHADVVQLCESALETSEADEQSPPVSPDDARYGFVYLAQGHRGEYKIGRTTLVDRRVTELGAMSPVPLTLVHEIKADDPVGVEAYWHKRFENRRMRGEWFKLNASEVRAFKRWRRIV